MRRILAAATMVAILSLIFAAVLLGTGEAAKASRPAPQSPAILDTQQHVDVNLIDMFVTNVGSFAWDVSTGEPGLIYPKGTTKTAVFAAGIWVGAHINGDPNPATEVAEYSQEYIPGPVIGGSFDPNWDNNPSYRVYKITKTDTTSADYLNWPVRNGAPFKVVNGDTLPDVLGDQMLWSVYNDLDPDQHTNNAGNSPPLGLEIQQSTFGFDRQGPLGEVVFLKFKLINKGTNTLDDTFVSVWSDPDLGSASDDLVGCDTALSLGYCYNATNDDGLYGRQPPAVGYDFFQGPIVPSPGDTAYVSGVPRPDFRNLPMTSFNKYINGTDPSSPDDTYNYMLGKDRDGSDLIDPTTGEVTPFQLSGDPINGTGWLDSNPGDRRLMLSAGPFTMAPGDTQEVVAAVVMGQGSSRLSSINALKFNDFFAQDAFDRNFDLPSPPPTPVVTAVPQQDKIVLSWDTRSENYTQPGYTFEGYNVYQGASIAGPWTRIATYDLVNGVRVVYDEVFDPERGFVVNVPVQYGSDSGLSQYIEVTEDAVRGGKLKEGTTYFFAVTAYGISETEAPKTLENAISSTGTNFSSVEPQSFTAETVLSDVPVTQHRVDSEQAPTSDRVEVTVVDPYVLTGHDYEIRFKPADPEFTFTTASGDIITVDTLWDLVDVTDERVVLANQYNKFGDTNYRQVEGFIVKVIGNYVPELTNATYVNANTAHLRGLVGVSSGGQFFNFSSGYGADFFGSSLDPVAMPDSFSTVEIRFSHTDTQKAHSFVRFAVGAPGRYDYRSFDTVPFTAWSVVPGRPDRQLNVLYVENDVPDEPSHPDSTWGPDNSSTGGREYLFVTNSAYTGEPNPRYMTNVSADAGEMDILYAGWWALRTDIDPAVIDDGDQFVFSWAKPATTNDTFAFTTAGAAVDDAKSGKAALAKIKTVPNPYYNRSLYEQNQFERRVKFINLPGRCTIRIFNLAGDLVRTLEKTDATTSILEWDLLTDNALPVASGVYVWHVDAPGIGQKFGRMAVFIEKERLNTF